MKNSILFIINPKNTENESVLFTINKFFNNSDFNWDIKITKKTNDAYLIAQKNLNNYDLFAAYGGDGTVAEVARALFQTNKHLIILPGGTGNAVAKDLQIDLNYKNTLKSLIKSNLKSTTVDMGTVNNRPFLLRVDIDMPALFIKKTDTELKKVFGSNAYAISFIKNIKNYKKSNYKAIINDKKEKFTGVGLSIANSGNFGIPGISIKPHIQTNDGKLDLLIMKEASINFIIDFIKGITSIENTPSIKSKQIKSLQIKFQENKDFMVDDIVITESEINIEVIPNSLNLLL